MRIEKILVDKLFGVYDYQLDLTQNEHITILHAPNGYGKTTLLKLIKAIIEGDFIYIDEIPFESIKLILDTKDSILVMKDDPYASLFNKNFNDLRNNGYRTDNFILPFTYTIDYFQSNRFRDKKSTIKINPDVVIRVARNYNTRFSSYRRFDGYEKYTFKEAIDRIPPQDYLFECPQLFEQLDYFKRFISIHIIESNRLLKDVPLDYQPGPMRNDDTPRYIESIVEYSRELKNEIGKIREEFTNKSLMLERTLPKRFLELIIKRNYKNVLNEEDIRLKLKTLEDRSVELEELGIINSVETPDLPSEVEMSDDARQFLTLYIQDNENKIEVFNDIKRKIKLLLNIINIKNRFSNKIMRIDREKGVIFELSNGREVPIEKLSSGEKNDFVLFYELIFKCHRNSIILIDEPEISLHIAWQQEFINELLDICTLNDMQAIVATHSPNIVNDYWNLMVDMEGVE